MQHSWVEVSARHDDLRLFGAVESSFQTEPQSQQARKQITAPHGGKDFSMSSVEGVRIESVSTGSSVWLMIRVLYKPYALRGELPN